MIKIITSNWSKEVFVIKEGKDIVPLTYVINDLNCEKIIGAFYEKELQGLSLLRDHKFRHCFQDTLNPLCDLGNDTETMTYFFLHCPSFHTPSQTLFNSIRTCLTNMFYLMVKIN